jgi:hypothetical protein
MSCITCQRLELITRTTPRHLGVDTTSKDCPGPRVIGDARSRLFDDQGPQAARAGSARMRSGMALAWRPAACFHRPHGALQDCTEAAQALGNGARSVHRGLDRPLGQPV